MLLTFGVIATAGFSQVYQQPTVLTPPAAPNGSNWSRAPAPAQRPLDDVTPPDGQAIDSYTQAAKTEPAVPAPTVAVFQGTTTTAPAYVATTYTPGLTPTGRTTVAYVSDTSYQSAQKPTVMTPPAAPNGSNWSRAPAPAQRPLDDVKGPDGQAIDQLPPNTPATNIEPPVPAPRIAVMQPASTPGYAVAEPALVPTGRNTVAVAATMDATTVAQSIRSATMANRDQVLADIESRLSASDKIMTSMSSVASDLNADVKAKASTLKKSISNARKDWDRNREQLAADYEAYAAALARVDAANGIVR
jgi:hypothetical protein